MEVVQNLSSVSLYLVVFLLTIAIIVILWMVLRLIIIFWIYCVRYNYGTGAKWCGGPNTWAVITGATDGIGLSYAKAMAQKDYNLVLMSRSDLKLNKVKNDIQLNYHNCIQIETIAVDFSQLDIYDYIEEELKKLGEIHVLINNVGMCYKYPEFFAKIDNKQFINDMINVNIHAMTRMINIVLPQMIAKQSGIIINVSSYSANFPTPLLSLYTATKIYGDYLSRALAEEYSRGGIIIQSVRPYYVSTNMIRNPNTSFMVPSADKFVKSALKTVGIEPITYGYFPHTLLAFSQNFLMKFLIGNDLNMKLALHKMLRYNKEYIAKSDKYTNNGSGTHVIKL